MYLKKEEFGFLEGDLRLECIFCYGEGIYYVIGYLLFKRCIIN